MKVYNVIRGLKLKSTELARSGLSRIGEAIDSLAEAGESENYKAARAERLEAKAVRLAEKAGLLRQSSDGEPEQVAVGHD